MKTAENKNLKSLAKDIQYFVIRILWHTRGRVQSNEYCRLTDVS